MSSADTTRQDRERQFHDSLYDCGDVHGGAGRESTGRFYSVFAAMESQFTEEVRRRAKGRRVLEIGCGVASMAFDLATVADEVLGIDISPVAVERSRAQAAKSGLTNATFETMDAERMSVPESSVDLVFATGVLHHLDIERAAEELVRVLTPKGSVMFLEPMGHNMLINAYRNRTPHLRTPDEHPLRRSDFDTLGNWFTHVGTRYHHLTTLASVPFRLRPWHSKLVSALERVDDGIFAVLPFLRYQAWYVSIDLSGPRSPCGPWAR